MGITHYNLCYRFHRNFLIMMEIEKVTIKATTPWLSYDTPRFLRVIEYFIRVSIFKQRRYLIDKWTIEEPQEFVCQYSIEIEEELLKILTKESNI